MGDMADCDIEQGEDMWFAHLVGNCFEDCRYCADEHMDDGDYIDGFGDSND